VPAPSSSPEAHLPLRFQVQIAIKFTDQAAPPAFVGVDVAKHRLEIQSRPSGESFTIEHDDENVAALHLVARIGGLVLAGG
jgi:hypothetical protein